MNTQQVHITANPTPNPDALKFIVDRQLVDGDPVTYNSAQAAAGSLLAEKLFQLTGVKSMFAYQNFVTITKQGDQPWQTFAQAIGRIIREHINSGESPNFLPREASTEGEDDEKVAIIKQVLDEIRPMVVQDGGNIVFAGYNDGIVNVFMQGSCSGCPSSTVTLKSGIETRLREVLPEIRDVVAI